MVKKSFNVNNPALDYITRPQEELQAETTATTQAPSVKQITAPTNFNFKPEQQEARSKRLQLLITPTLQAKLKQVAKNQKVSVNQIINVILEQSLKEE